MPRYTVAVYHHPEERRESLRWSCAIQWWSPSWAGFVGAFEVEAENATDAHKQARAMAQAKHAASSGEGGDRAP